MSKEKTIDQMNYVEVRAKAIQLGIKVIGVTFIALKKLAEEKMNEDVPVKVAKFKSPELIEVPKEVIEKVKKEKKEPNSSRIENKKELTKCDRIWCMVMIDQVDRKEVMDKLNVKSTLINNVVNDYKKKDVKRIKAEELWKKA